MTLIMAMKRLALIAIFFLEIGNAKTSSPQIVERVRTFFLEEQYAMGLDYLKDLREESASNLPIERYISIFYSYRLKQLFESKKIFKAIALTSKINRFNKMLLEQYPSSSMIFSAALMGRGEGFQYKPALLGGSLQQAEKYFLQSLGSNATTYEAYKTLIFYLNSKSNMAEAKRIIERIQKGEFKKEPILEDFFQAKVIYQEGVRWYLLGKHNEARERLTTCLKLQPENYWCYYVLSRVEKALGLKYEKTWQLARLFGERWNNKIFLDKMQKEES